ncbi:MULTISPECIES: hypothetical protein [unclassified Methylophaga]|jgi:hypothetical protein|uniref:hypothetical protein n=1 Tax=unclassified Methylophaga TaxID=2629249 RepID=UPI000C97CB38|nr:MULTISPECIES: hypothetical protein [unclassified Methylophaga]MAK65963.1 hypothetical protein [Methylophaga sp.]MAY18660.1 hypothetical protein [Methylophaga sp.]HAO25575.1 hypothetical protein [Methylophaga sp.]HCD06619.1 hypothetical protein [Methylophaga sp.]|tara:strand:- start:41904 stop:42206 length:303 start_codon:yes stop_codon:yes gene_type:complete
MMQRYQSLDDLWCEWGSATTAIMKHIESNEPIDNQTGWNFVQAMVVSHHQEGYVVTIVHTAYDPSISGYVLLSVQAKVCDSGEINVTTVKRALVDQAVQW